MSPAAAAIVIVVAVLCASAYGLGMLFGKRGEPLRDWFAMRTRHRQTRRELATLDVAEGPQTRPIEAIVVDLRRVGSRFHALAPHASYAKVEAVRSAYDRVLIECCASLSITHLLGVLAPGPQLDVERERVEELIAGCGVRLPFAA